MAGRHGRWSMALVLLLGAVLPSPALAGPYFGEWSWCWHPAPDCSRGDYCRLHYWAPELYRVRAFVHPSSVDQYPPGPCPPVAPIITVNQSPCQSTPPAPTAPYADPTGYYGIAIAPSAEK